ncbi:putative glutamine catalytic protein [Botrytis fragariae]|uniref:Putative glutamine catalytic protein n=1 Tax=Botrytis fragariae TaxID=1964551 RepID=A0A8H6B0F6_9HELO|nr:putative glutamine catalytic protein [Botrytis fragariae]KAF5876822.1 putative glutamine catalytic protein [Botrytis fragariae]
MSLPNRPSFQSLVKFLDLNPEVEFIRYQFLDIGNVLRLITVAKSHALNLAEKPLKVSCLSLGCLPDDSINITRFQPAGYDELYPDWKSLRLCSYVENGETHASVMCFVKEMSRNFPPWKRDPRSILYETLNRAEKLGFQFLIGFELEFHLARIDGERSIKQVSQFYGAAAFRDRTISQLIEECIRCLLNSGIEATHFHSEVGHGMFEIPTGPLRPIEAIDTLVYCKEAIQTISLKHGFKATFFPKPVLSPSQIAVGAHVHFSIDNTTQEIADNFLAGILDNLPALCGFSMPNHDSYHRLGGHRGTIGTWVGWGEEDKDIAVRKISGRIGYWEIRCADQMANMFYVLSAWITAGTWGVRNKLLLKWKNPQSLVAEMSREQVAELNWDTKLPLSLIAAITALEGKANSEPLSELGEEFLHMYIDFKKLEAKQAGEKTEEERLDVLTTIF